MANPIQLYERRSVLAKIESVYGTDSLPVAGTDGALTFEGKISILADKLERAPDLAYFGANPYVLTNKRAEIEVTVELLGHATAGNAAPIGPLLRACGMAQTLSAGVSSAYGVVSSGQSALTVYFNHAGILFKVTGCRGNMTIDCQIGGYLKGTIKLTGKITPASDISEAAPSTPTLTAFQKPVAIEEATFFASIGGVTVNCAGATADMGNKVVLFEGSEAREAAITDRMPTGNIMIFQEALGTFNPWSIADSHTPQAIILRVGSTPKRSTITFAAAQLGYPEPQNKDGAMVWSIPFSGLPDAGNDDIAFLFE